MRKVILATLALFPVMLHAQANSPAQPESSDNVSAFNASASSPKYVGTADTVGPVRLSSGVVAPKLVHTVAVSLDENEFFKTGISKIAVVEMVVDQDGKPSELKIVKSLGDNIDKSVLTAVNQFRFEPGTVSHQPVASPVKLEIEIVNLVR